VGKSESGKGQEANRRRGACHSLVGREMIARERIEEWALTRDWQVVSGHGGGWLDVIGRHGRQMQKGMGDSMRSVGGNKELAMLQLTLLTSSEGVDEGSP
jgi:hypothetical protein